MQLISCMPQIFIETPRLILRQWQESDHEPYIQLNMDNEVMEFFPSTKTREESLAQMERLSKRIDDDGYGFFAAERKDTGQFIGFIGISHPGFESYFTPCIEVGWRLSREHWGYGFATEGGKACLDFGFEKLSAKEIYAFTAVHNQRSENVMKKIGMIKLGLFDHPQIEDGHTLKKHVVYKTT